MIYHKIQHEISSTWFITTYGQKHYGLAERIQRLGKTSHGDITPEQRYYNLVKNMEIYRSKEKDNSDNQQRSYSQAYINLFGVKTATQLPQKVRNSPQIPRSSSASAISTCTESRLSLRTKTMEDKRGQIKARKLDILTVEYPRETRQYCSEN